MTAMEIIELEQKELTQSERDEIAGATERSERMGTGAHLNDWLALAPAVSTLRRLAMRLAHVNQPQGRGYNEAFARLMKHHKLDVHDKQSITAILWLTDNPEHATILREIRDAMTPGERARLNSPISARQRVQKVLDARTNGGEAESKLKGSPVALLREQIAVKDREIADLKAKLARSDGSLFDLKQDTADDIGRVIVDTLSDYKAEQIEQAIKKARTARKRRPTPAG
jgi:hypothetical protein